MTEEPQRFSFRMLRYIEPGSDSPWKEVFGTQSDGTHRPQYYSQLELPKILEQIQRDGKTWFPLELAIARAQKGLWIFTHKGEQVAVSSDEVLCAIKVLQNAVRAKALKALSLETFYTAGIKSASFARFLLETALSASAQVSSVQVLSPTIHAVGTVSAQASTYCKVFYFIFCSSEGKALARAVLKLYTEFNTSGDVSSSFMLGHLKGFLGQGTCSSVLKLRLKQLLASSGFIESLVNLGLISRPRAETKVTCALKFSARKHYVSASSCFAKSFLDYIGYGVGFYNYGLYGV